MTDISGARALVTGGASGIGRGIVEALLGRGATVAIVDIDPDAVEKCLNDFRGMGRVSGFVADVSNMAEVENLREEVEGRFGTVDILANNAGVAYNLEPLWATPPEMVDWSFAVNVMGVYHGIRVFVPGMIDRGRGHVLNTASIGGFQVRAHEAWHQGLYAATKYAVVAFSESLKIDLEGTGVGVSVLAPAGVVSKIATSDRNRPARYGGPNGISQRPEAASLVANGLDPLVVGGHVVDAIERDRFYIFTHPEMRDVVARRHESIMQGFAESIAYSLRTGGETRE